MAAAENSAKELLWLLVKLNQNLCILTVVEKVLYGSKLNYLRIKGRKAIWSLNGPSQILQISF